MRIANVEGRLKLLVAQGAVDVETASQGRFGSDPQAAYERFDDLTQWAGGITQPSEDFHPETAGPPVPAPGEVFAIGLNYRDHVSETGRDLPESPVVFTKYPSSFSGPVSQVTLPEGSVDWEVELVVVISKTAPAVPVERAWEHVVGLDRRARPVRASSPTQRSGTPVRSGQVLCRLLLRDLPSSHPTSSTIPTTWVWVFGQWRGDAECPHGRHDLPGRRADRLPFANRHDVSG